LLGSVTAPAVAAPARPVAASPPACHLEVAGSGRVVAIPDGRSLTLDDGREVRLAGIEVPPAAKAALEQLLLGQTVELHQRQPASDRYGRILAFVSLASPPEDAEPSLAHALIGRGWPGSGPASTIRPAPPSFCHESVWPAPKGLACGANRIMPS
jgi:endonuclease YncB( thermonuclease family)